jgi:SAM-dependent methyltransferase
MDKQTGELLLQALDRMEGSISTMRAVIQEAMKTPGPQSAPRSSLALASHRASGVSKRSKIQVAESLPANLLGPLPDYEGDDWPQAASPYMIVSNKGEAEKQFRALQIVGLIGIPFADKNVLDIGCGEGHIAKEIASQAATVIAYDPRPHSGWDELSNSVLKFTDQKSQVTAGGPYNSIILYDVLDHLEREDPVSFMAWVGSLLAPEGQIFVRAHPWTSRHGSHLYEAGPNRAFLHLALTPDELASAGLELPWPNLRIVRPMAAYEHIFREAGLKVLERNGHTEPVEPYFSGSVLDRILKVTWRGAVEPEAALKIMQMNFVDYHLGRREPT